MSSTTIAGLEVERLGHSGFRIESGTDRLYIDAFDEVLSSEEPAGNLVVSTHDHWDHFDPEAIMTLATADATAVVHEASETIDIDDVRQVRAGDSLGIDGVDVSVVPAHNLVRMREPGEPFHPEGEGVGYVIDMNGTSIYHTGDTEPLDHMADIDVDVMLVPIGGAYVMNLDDAYWALHMVQPEMAVPMHYGQIDDSKPDASGFEDVVADVSDDAGIEIEARVL
jgi:L-ascorbate metabolism protein UlaG (beta-lactamase superfamily)